jgi:phage portal protein BeeE
MVLHLFRSAKPAPVEAKASAAARVVPIHGTQVRWSARDAGTLTRVGFLGNPVGFRCVKLIAEAASAVPLVVQDVERRFERIPSSTFWAIRIRSRGAGRSSRASTATCCSTGDGYLEAAGVHPSGGPRELYVLRSDRMTVVPGADGWPVAYEYAVGTRKHRFDMREERVPVLHVRNFHPQDDHYGLSPMQAAAAAVDVHNAASRWSKALLDNAARPSGAIVYKGVDGAGMMSAEQHQRLVDEIETYHQGAQNAGRPMLLEGGLDWKQIGFSPSGHGVPPYEGGGGAGGCARLRGAADAAGAAGRQHLRQLCRGAPGVLPADGAAAGGQDACGDLGLAAPLVRRAVRAAVDYDNVPALAEEREALWRRIEAASFLTDGEKRQLLGPSEGAES